MKFKLALLIACWSICFGFGLSTSRGNEASSNYPTRTVQLIVPFAAGGSSDGLMRMLAQIVSQEWKQPIIVENRPGATGAIAGDYVVRQPADGYTLLNAAPSSMTALSSLRRNLSYNPMKDLAPVTLLQLVPNLLVVNPTKVAAHNVEELIDYLKANPGKVSYASTGIGSTGHLAVELFKILTSTDMVQVPYKGNAPALNDLVAGNVDLTIDGASSVGSQVKAGKLLALAVTSPKRTARFPDLPTVAETVPGFETQTWNGLVVRSGTPPEIIEKISRDFGRAVRQPEVVAMLSNLLTEAVGNSPDEFRTFVDADQARWARVVQALNITTD
jgi:tripartite-type tricarboxylate transporter receptor subunit TctC